MKLPITLQKKFTSLFQYSLPLCAILSHPLADRWYYSHYMSIIGKESSDSTIWFWYTDSFDYLSENKANECFKLVKLSINDVKKYDFLLSKYIKLNLEENRYLIVFVDEFYISNSVKYKQAHYLHEYLIFGIDEPVGTVSCVGFDSRNTYSYVTICMEEFELGFYAVIDGYKEQNDFINDKVIITFQVQDFTQIPSLEVNRTICTRLMEYSMSKYNKTDNLIFEQFFEQDDVRCGFQTIDLLIRAFEYLLTKQSYSIDIRQVLMIYEIRQSIYVRLKRILEPQMEFALLNDYEEIIKRFKSIYMNVIKYSLMTGGDGFVIYNNSILPIKDKLEEKVQYLKNTKEMEQKVLERLIKNNRFTFQ